MTDKSGLKNLPLYKMITLGDTAVGKSAMLTRLINDRFSSHHLSTLGLD